MYSVIYGLMVIKCWIRQNHDIQLLGLWNKGTIKMPGSDEQELAAIRKTLKELLIEELSLEDLTPEQIGDDEILFGEGLELDSLDAVEVVVILQRKFGLEIPEGDRVRDIFYSVNTLSKYIHINMKPDS